MIGQTISHYKIVEKLGEGGMGVVYKAEDTKLQRMVALKFLPQHVTATEADQSRFLQEARAASALNHPNVCVIHAIEEAENQQFIAMEFVDGVTLREKISVGAQHVEPLRINDVVAYAIQIGDALMEAHNKGIVHRDIKADNIMINSKNQIKVMDFGLAKLKGSLKLTRTSSTVGTLAYMAPEQIQGGEVDARSDIFSFGVLLYEMLTGKTPFRGEHEAAMVYSIVNEEPDPVQKYRPELSAEFIHILSTALEKDPEDRYQSVSEMVRDLRRVQKQSSKVSRKYSTEELKVQKDLRGQEAVPPEIPTRSSETKKEPNKKMLWLGLSAAVGIVILFGMYKLLSKGRSESTTSFQSMKITRLTSNGKTRSAAMSPDGKYVVYSQDDGGKQSLWVRQVATGSNVQIIPPAEVFYSGMTMSKDGNYIYYNVRPQNSNKSTAYQVPVLGGSPKILIDDVSSPITVSPDAKRFAFQRNYSTTGDFAIMVANMDGSGEQKLASHKADLWFAGGPAWSPDGKVIAAFLGSWEGGFHYNLVTVQVDNSAEKILSSHRWNGIGGVQWLDDGSGLILTATEKGSNVAQIWQVSLPSGDTRRITNDLNNYSNLNLTGDSQTLSVVQSDVRSNIWILPEGEVNRTRKITSGKDEGQGGLCWTPDGKIIYTSTASGNPDLWIMDKNGNNQKQLTSDPSSDWNPAVSSEGRYIFFVSDRSGIPNIWRIESEGVRPKQITSGGEDYNPNPSPDGKWIIFDSWDTGPLLVTKVPFDGGEPASMTEKASTHPVFSPDGKFVAYIFLGEQQSNARKIEIIPFEGGKPVHSFEFPPLADNAIRWTRDGRAISYNEQRNGIDNIWNQPINGIAPKRVTSFTSDYLGSFDWSPEGKELAVTRVTASTDVILISDFR